MINEDWECQLYTKSHKEWYGSTFRQTNPICGPFVVINPFPIASQGNETRRLYLPCSKAKAKFVS